MLLKGLLRSNLTAVFVAGWGVGLGGILLASAPPARASECDVRFERMSACADLVWTDPPTEYEEAVLQLRFEQPAPAALQAELFMPSMGHGSSPVRVKKIAADTFEVSKIFFVMPGDWEIRFTWLSPDGTAMDRGTFNLKF